MVGLINSLSKTHPKVLVSLKKVVDSKDYHLIINSIIYLGLEVI